LRAQIEKNSQKEFVYLKRHLSPEEAAYILSLKLPGLYGTNEYRRYYPASDVTAQLLGFTNVDDEGQEGAELAFDKELRGIPGKKQVLKDRLGHIIKEVQELEPPRPGRNIELSIDLRLQYLAFRELKAAVEKHDAQDGTAVVLDAKSGEILAMVNYPTYNPNNRNKVNIAAMRNMTVTDVFEPGSTVKPFTIAAGLTQGTFTPTTLIDTNPGYFQVGNKTIRDHSNYGVIDVTTVLTKSSNIGATKIALSMEGNQLWQVFHNAGLGNITGSGFPGERSGFLPQYKKWHPIEQATMSYGYGISVTPLQLAQAYLTFANGGQRPSVTLIKRQTDEEIPVERVMSADVANEVLAMLETVTQAGGTATRAAIPAYRVGGKTGTAHKLASSGGYDENRYLALFAGLVPLSNPAIVAVVMIDDPKGDQYYGGEVSAPVFSSVASAALRLLNIAPDDLPAESKAPALSSVTKKEGNT
jgi:cell division protein FtsI (penicillin-binding protein 3)